MSARRGERGARAQARGRGRPRARGFTLLEVLISIAILSLGLSTVFGSSVLAARGTAHARFVTQATLQAQCRMAQIEIYLRREKLPDEDRTLDDPIDTGDEPCCTAPFTCVARVEKIELPDPANVQTAAGDRMLNSAAQAARGTSFGGGGAGDGGAGASGGNAPGGSDVGRGADPLSGGGAIGQLAQAMGALGSGGGAGRTPAAGLASALTGGGGGSGGGSMAGAGAPDMGGMVTQMLSSIYPTLKPSLEGAIRKVIVEMRWHEGTREFRFDLVQYVTNPGQTLQSETGLNAIDRLLGRGAGGLPGAAGAPGQPGAPAAPSVPGLPR